MDIGIDLDEFLHGATDTTGDIFGGFFSVQNNLIKGILDPINKLATSASQFLSSMNPNMLLLAVGGVALVMLLKK